MDNTGQELTVKELADQLHVSKQTIQNKADALGIVFEIRGNRRIVTPEQAEAIRQAMQKDPDRAQPRQRRSSRARASKAGTSTEEPDSMAIDLLKDQLRHQAEEIQFLRSLVVSLQNEKNALLQLAAPEAASDTEQTGASNDTSQSAADLRTEPAPAAPEPITDQAPAPAAGDPEPLTLWGKIRAFLKG